MYRFTKMIDNNFALNGGDKEGEIRDFGSINFNGKNISIRFMSNDFTVYFTVKNNITFYELNKQNELKI